MSSNLSGHSASVIDNIPRVPKGAEPLDFLNTLGYPGQSVPGSHANRLIISQLGLTAYFVSSLDPHSFTTF